MKRFRFEMDVLVKIGGSASVEISLIDEKKAPIKSFKHIEYAPKITVLNGKTDKVCTHQEPSNSEPKDSMDWEKVYSDVISKYRETLINPSSSTLPGCLFKMDAASDSELINKVGYLIKDLNGDSIPEISICKKEGYFEGVIYAMYTYKDSTPNLVLGSEVRDRYYFIDDTYLLNEGSWSAAGAICQIVTINKEGNGVDAVDAYYSDDTDFNNIIYYHNDVIIDKTTYQNETNKLNSQTKIFELKQFK